MEQDFEEEVPQSHEGSNKMKITKKNAIVAYKGFNLDFTCKGFKYEVGKSYRCKGKIEPCVNGFHACSTPYAVNAYYPINPLHRFCEVRLWGNVEEAADKLCSSNIEIGPEIPYQTLIEECNIGYGNEGVFNIGRRNKGSYNIGSGNTGGCNLGLLNKGWLNIGDENTGDKNIGYFNKGDYNIGDYNIGSFNLGDHNIGSFNLGDHNTGWFNTKSWDDYRWFDKPAKKRPHKVCAAQTIINVVYTITLHLRNGDHTFSISYPTLSCAIGPLFPNKEMEKYLYIINTLNEKRKKEIRKAVKKETMENKFKASFSIKEIKP